MRARRNQPEHIFERHLGQRERGQRAVDRGDDHGSARGQHRGDGGGEQPPVGDMFDHFGRIDDIKHCSALGQRLGGDAVIVDVQTALRGVLTGGLYGLRGGVDAGNRAAEPGHRFCQQTATTADIQNAQPGKTVVVRACADAADAVQNIVDADRREIMKWRHRPLGIPPLR